jgi:hypothetical protein
LNSEIRASVRPSEGGSDRTRACRRTGQVRCAYSRLPRRSVASAIALRRSSCARQAQGNSAILSQCAQSGVRRSDAIASQYATRRCRQRYHALLSRKVSRHSRAVGALSQGRTALRRAPLRLQIHRAREAVRSLAIGQCRTRPQRLSDVHENCLRQPHARHVCPMAGTKLIRNPEYITVRGEFWGRVIGVTVRTPTRIVPALSPACR